MYSGVKEHVVWGMVVGGIGWKLEVQIPWANICNGSIPADDIDQYVLDSIQNNKRVGIELSLVNANALDTRSSIMNWANNTTRDTAYYSNEFYGEITLVDGPMSVRTNSVNELKIYPTVASQIIYIANGNINKYEIIDISGKVVAEGRYLNNGINVSRLQNGIYFLKAVDYNNNLTVNKFVKK
jgi:hypothetical protein